MTQTAKDIIEFLEKRYEINNSTRNFIINKIEEAIKSAYNEGGSSNGCDCGQMSCIHCHG